MSVPRYLFDVEKIILDGWVRRGDVDKIQAWSIPQKGIPELSLHQVVVFLLACSGDLEATKSAILTFYTVQGGTPELFSDRSLYRPDLQKALDVVRIGVLPKRTSNNCGVLVLHLQDTTYYNLEMGPVVKLSAMSLHSMVYDNPPKSFIAILDMKGIGLMHMTRIVFRLLKPFFRYVQEALPVRIEEILIINTVYFMNKIMAIIKPFMNLKLMEKLHFHTPDMDLQDFFKEYLDEQFIPSDYGGSGPSLDDIHASNAQKLEEMDRFFKEDEEQRDSVKKQ